ncbi:hypothetical protein L198_06717 [Cryptococcus wingfieldii CBS 7118]|uniref:Uncharacterized protein n=1 Tax=Cryptococcus wingfieldii CBS 7118 TaxID=1295528 RepID=A0A1E3IJ19_9TREE|nr:hypothetical protein L198_06717 [Cryptococcus wingfieldii CBS 7118]ODN88445.1 hypothetical protein L198_06717 [Cryptococcus wingfieldii CBS 7118]
MKLWRQSNVEWLSAAGVPVHYVKAGGSRHRKERSHIGNVSGEDQNGTTAKDGKDEGDAAGSSVLAITVEDCNKEIKVLQTVLEATEDWIETIEGAAAVCMKGKSLSSSLSFRDIFTTTQEGEFIPPPPPAIRGHRAHQAVLASAYGRFLQIIEEDKDEDGYDAGHLQQPGDSCGYEGKHQR